MGLPNALRKWGRSSKSAEKVGKGFSQNKTGLFVSTVQINVCLTHYSLLFLEMSSN